MDCLFCHVLHRRRSSVGNRNVCGCAFDKVPFSLKLLLMWQSLSRSCLPHRTTDRPTESSAIPFQQINTCVTFIYCYCSVCFSVGIQPPLLILPSFAPRLHRNWTTHLKWKRTSGIIKFIYSPLSFAKTQEATSPDTCVHMHVYKYSGIQMEAVETNEMAAPFHPLHQLFLFPFSLTPQSPAP